MAEAHLGMRAAPVVEAPNVRTITVDDLKDCLARGYADFMAMPSHLAFLGLIYPILGVFLAGLAFGYDLLPLLFPLASGFALIGPLAGIGLYELSWRREQKLEPRWQDAFEVLRSPAIGSIIAMGAVLVAIFLAWLAVANAIYLGTVAPLAPASHEALVRDILTTPQGWVLILVGNAVGFVFAACVLAISVIAFPLIIDRRASVGVAVATSLAAVRTNPGVMAIWGAIVAALLAIGSIPIFVGLAIVMPILGHATWHLYRKVVV